MGERPLLVSLRSTAFPRGEPDGRSIRSHRQHRNWQGSLADIEKYAYCAGRGGNVCLSPLGEVAREA